MDQKLQPLFTPWKIGNCEIKNRIVLTSMGGTDLFGWMEINHFDKAGAKFIVSPGLSKEVAKVCKKKNIPYYPGIVTPTEIMEALSLGLTVLKFFPSNCFGGLKTMKALSSAFPKVKFIPTGGVDSSNIEEYLAWDKIFAVGGSAFVKESLEKCQK